MKILLYITSILLASFSFGCKPKDGNLFLKTVDTNTSFKFTAKFDESRTGQLKEYLDSALNNKLPLKQNIDLFVDLNGADKYNLKANSGWLEVNFDKRNTSMAGYMKVKKLTEGIQEIMTRK